MLLSSLRLPTLARRTRLMAAASLLALALSAGGSAAYAGTPEEAEAIRASLQKTLDGLLTPEMLSSGALTADGVLTVVETADGTGYLATSPAYTFKDDADATAAIPPLTVTFVPTGAPNRYNVSLTVPSQITQMSALKVPQMRFTLAQQSYTGVYDISLSAMLSMDMAYSGIKLEDLKLKSRLEIASLTGKTQMTEDSPGIFSGPASFNMADVGFTDDNGNKVLNVKALTMESSVQSMDMANYMKLGEMAQAMQAKAETDEKAMMKAAHDVLSTLPGPLMKSLDGTIMLTGLVVNDPKDGTKVNLDMGKYAFAISGLDSDAGMLKLGSTFAGLSVAPLPESEAEMVPSSGELALTIGKVPVKQVSAAVLTALRDGQTQDSFMVERAFTSTLQTALETSGIEIHLEKLALNAPIGTASATGMGTVDGTAALKVTGNMTAVLGGLDEAVTKLQAKQKALEGKADGADQAGQIAQMLQGLAVAQMMGEQGKDASGRSTRTYNFELGKDGEPKLNGAPLGAMMGSGGSVPLDEPAPAE